MENRYVEFIARLIEKSKNGKITWQYLDSDPRLCQDLKLAEKPLISIPGTPSYDFSFNTESSYYYQDGNIYIVLVSTLSNKEDDSDDDGVYLEVVPNTYKQKMHLSGKNYCTELVRLKNVVKSLFPNPDDYIDGFMKK